MLPEEQADWNQRFVAYGGQVLRALNDGGLEPAGAPAYVLSHYAGHLERAGAQAEGFYALLSAGWMRAWYTQQGTYEGFLNDVEKAWRAAEAVFLDGDSPEEKRSQAALVQVRCALYRASVLAQSGNLPPALLKRCLKEGVRTPAQILALVLQKPEGQDRDQALVEIYPVLSEAQKARIWKVFQSDGDDQRRFVSAAAALASELTPERAAQALSAARGLENRNHVVTALTALAAALPPARSEAVLKEALDTAEAIPSEQALATVLQDLIPVLPETLAAQGLRLVERLPDSRRIRPFIRLVPRLPLREAEAGLKMAASFQDRSYRVQALSSLALHLALEKQPRAITQALDEARLLEDQHERLEALILLLPSMEKDQRVEVTGEVLEGIRSLETGSQQVFDALNLAQAVPPHEKEELVREALDQARKIEKVYELAYALVSLVPHLPEALQDEVVPEAVRAVRAFRTDPFASAGLLGDLVPYLRGNALQDALRAAHEIDSMKDRAKALSDLATCFSGETQKALFQEALAAAAKVANEYDLGPTLAYVAERLPADLLGDALAVAQGAVYFGYRSEAIDGLAPFLTPALLVGAWKASQSIRDTAEQAHVLGWLAPRLLPERLEDGLTEALRLPEKRERVEALLALAPNLSQASRNTAVAAAMQTARSLGEPAWRAQALAELLPRLAVDQQAQALEAAIAAIFEISREEDTFKAITALAPHMPLSRVDRLLVEAEKVENESDRFWIVLLFIAQMQPEQLPQAQKLAQTIQDPNKLIRVLHDLTLRSSGAAQEDLLTGCLHLVETQKPVNSGWWLYSLLSHLPGRHVRTVVDTARAALAGSQRVWVLCQAIPRLPSEQRAALVSETLAIVEAMDEETFPFALPDLLPYLAEDQREEMLTAALASVRKIQSGYARASRLSGLAPHLPPEQRVEVCKEALRAAQSVDDETGRGQALREVAACLPDALLTDGLASAQSAGYLGAQLEALRGLAPRLPPHLLVKALLGFQDIQGTYYEQALALFGPYLTQRAGQQPSQARAFLPVLLRAFSARQRPYFLQALGALAPFLLALLGKEQRPPAATGVFDAIRQAAEWWPSVKSKKKNGVLRRRKIG